MEILRWLITPIGASRHPRRVVRRYARGMIEIKAEPKSAIEVELVGTVYKIQPPKAALALKLAIRAKAAAETPDLMMASIDEWILAAFGKAGAAKIQRRLDDPADALDVTHVMQLMEAVVEEAAAPNPTS